MIFCCSTRDRARNGFLCSQLLKIYACSARQMWPLKVHRHYSHRFFPFMGLTRDSPYHWFLGYYKTRKKQLARVFSPPFQICLRQNMSISGQYLCWPTSSLDPSTHSRRFFRWQSSVDAYFTILNASRSIYKRFQISWQNRTKILILHSISVSCQLLLSSLFLQ